MKVLVYLLFLTVASLGCKNSKQSPSKEPLENDLSQQNWKSVESENGKYILYYMNIEVNEMSPKRDFYIEDASGNIIFESSIYGGYIKWYDSSKVEYFSTPGTIPSNMDKDDFIMIYDVETGKSFKKSSLNE